MGEQRFSALVSDVSKGFEAAHMARINELLKITKETYTYVYLYTHIHNSAQSTIPRHHIQIGTMRNGK